LRITIEANLKTVDFLDVTLDLRSGLFKPYTKPNNVPQYVHCNSNHPPNIIKNIPLGINRRLSAISSNQEIFNAAAPLYQEALSKSGYDYKLKYDSLQDISIDNTKKRCRKRNITWFNPPYSENVSTNIGRNFLNILEKCFPPGHQLRSILNRNTVKLSYSCTPNIQQIISGHNRKVLVTAEKQKLQDKDLRMCNCQKSRVCPIDGLCLSESVIYQALVTREDNGNVEKYVGLTANTFKTRYSAHAHSFRTIGKRNETTLSQYIWSLKDENVQFSLKWKIISKARAYSPATNRCNLCLTEKYYIIHKPDMATINKRNELASSCRHKKKFKLNNS
jgi:hypothetical protein